MAIIRRTNQNVQGRRRWCHDTDLLPTFTLQVLEFPVLLILVSLSLLVSQGAQDYLEFLTGFSTLGCPRTCLGITGLSWSLFSEPDRFVQPDTFPKNEDPSILGDFSPLYALQVGAGTNVQCGSDTAANPNKGLIRETFVNFFNG